MRKFFRVYRAHRKNRAWRSWAFKKAWESLREPNTPHKGADDMTEGELRALIQKAQIQYESLTPEQKAARDEAQKASFVRGMKPTGDPRFD